uniref:Protein kinase domain-containing protein n=1 Tax=Arcella intermedia TaxID=1963864 RepID=A0A6B2LDM3_9EUKA
MEYMENGSLHDLLRRSDLHPNQIHKIAKEIALGMNYLHGESILHRDLTSKNILLSKHMEAKVADFGLSKVKMGESQTFSDTIGSLAWMAPEVIANAKKFSKSSDVYSYGILLWELWTGRDPCPTDIAPVNLANKVLHDNYRPEIPPHVPKEWQDLIKVCWDTDVGVRPTFEKILQILESIPHQNLHVVPLPHTYAQSVIPHTQTFPHHSDVHVIPHTQTFPRHGHGGSFTAPERCTVPTHASLPVIGTDELSSVRGSDYADMLGADVDQ